MKRAPYVCVCVRACVCVRPCINKKCYFSISWPILMFDLIGLGADFKILHRILKFINYQSMQIYSKSMKNATLSFLGRF